MEGTKKQEEIHYRLWVVDHHPLLQSILALIELLFIVCINY